MTLADINQMIRAAGIPIDGVNSNGCLRIQRCNCNWNNYLARGVGAMVLQGTGQF